MQYILPAPPFISLSIGHVSGGHLPLIGNPKKLQKMGESKHNQDINKQLAFFRHETTTATYQEDIPPLITKKWLCIRFGLMRPGGTIYYRGLYEKVLTASVIAAMNSTEDEIRSARLRVFNREQTLKLIEILGL